MNLNAVAFTIGCAAAGWLLASAIWHAAWTHATLRPQLFRRALLMTAATALALAPLILAAEFLLPGDFGFVPLAAAPGVVVVLGALIYRESVWRAMAATAIAAVYACAAAAAAARLVGL